MSVFPEDRSTNECKIARYIYYDESGMLTSENAFRDAILGIKPFSLFTFFEVDSTVVIKYLIG